MGVKFICQETPGIVAGAGSRGLRCVHGTGWHTRAKRARYWKPGQLMLQLQENTDGYDRKKP